MEQEIQAYYADQKNSNKNENEPVKTEQVSKEWSHSFEETVEMIKKNSDDFFWSFFKLLKKI